MYMIELKYVGFNDDITWLLSCDQRYNRCIYSISAFDWLYTLQPSAQSSHSSVQWHYIDMLSMTQCGIILRLQPITVFTELYLFTYVLLRFGINNQWWSPRGHGLGLEAPRGHFMKSLALIGRQVLGLGHAGLIGLGPQVLDKWLTQNSFTLLNYSIK